MFKRMETDLSYRTNCLKPHSTEEHVPIISVSSIAASLGTQGVGVLRSHMLGYVPLRMHISSRWWPQFCKSAECADHGNSRKDLLRQRIESRLFTLSNLFAWKAAIALQPTGVRDCRVYVTCCPPDEDKSSDWCPFTDISLGAHLLPAHAGRMSYRVRMTVCSVSYPTPKKILWRNHPRWFLAIHNFIARSRHWSAQVRKREPWTRSSYWMRTAGRVSWERAIKEDVLISLNDGECCKPYSSFHSIHCLT